MTAATDVYTDFPPQGMESTLENFARRVPGTYWRDHGANGDIYCVVKLEADLIRDIHSNIHYRVIVRWVNTKGGASEQYRTCGYQSNYSYAAVARDVLLEPLEVLDLLAAGQIDPIGAFDAPV